MAAVKGVVFDMDGIIFDTERLSMEGWTFAARQTGDGVTQAAILEAVGLDFANTRRVFEEHLGRKLDFGALEAQRLLYIERYIEEHGIPQKPGLLELLDHLQSRRCKTALATSTKSEKVRAYLRQAGLSGRFDAIVCRDDVSSPKPAPDIYLRAAERIGVSPESCLALEDSPSGVLSAYRAGLRVVMVPDLILPGAETKQYLFAEVPTLADVIPLLG